MTESDHLHIKTQAGDTPAAQLAARLVGNLFDPQKIHEVGSSIRLCKNLYATAKHVLEDYLECFGENNGQLQAPLWAAHVHPGPEYSLWQVDRFWLAHNQDLAIFHTIPYNDYAASHAIVPCARVNVHPLSLEQRVVSFGYRRSTSRVVLDPDGSRHIDLNATPEVSVGEIVEVLPNGRGDRRLSFPCFRFSGQVDGGMSGGPIFNDAGDVCGLVCDSISEAAGEYSDFVSYGSMLWPLMGIEIDIGADGQVTRDPYPLLELAKSGLISVNGWENIDLHYSAEGRVRAVWLAGQEPRS